MTLQFGKPNSKPDDWQPYEGFKESPLECSKCRKQVTTGFWKYADPESETVEVIVVCHRCKA